MKRAKGYYPGTYSLIMRDRSKHTAEQFFKPPSSALTPSFLKAKNHSSQGVNPKP